jgi:uncharacterized membrane protein YqjE
LATNRMDPKNEPAGGLSAALRTAAIAGLSYLRARLELAGVEGKEAFARLGGVLLLAVLATTLMIAGFLLLCVAVVFSIALLFGGGNAWIWVAAVMGLALLGGAWAVLSWARGWLGKPMFAATLEEFRKDDAWLRPKAERPR